MRTLALVLALLLLPGCRNKPAPVIEPEPDEEESSAEEPSPGPPAAGKGGWGKRGKGRANPNAIQRLIKAVEGKEKGDDPLARTAAVKSLAAIGPPAVPALVKTLGHER